MVPAQLPRLPGPIRQRQADAAVAAEVLRLLPVLLVPRPRRVFLALRLAAGHLADADLRR